VMQDRMVCVQQEAGAGTVRTWHLEGVPGETLCGHTAQSMKVLPKAAWDQVLNPCTHCQLQADLPAAVSESQHDLAEDPQLIDDEHEIGRQARPE
jgi:hypothetical protein